MPKAIHIIVNQREFEAELADTPCAEKIAKALPIRGRANTWGEEIYFDIGVEAELDSTARDIVELGDIGFWPPGGAICFFFGQTPISAPNQIRPASAVNLVGRILGDLGPLKQVRDGDEALIVAKAETP